MEMLVSYARYLMSTGGDGTVCFWKWDIATNKFEYVFLPCVVFIFKGNRRKISFTSFI